MTTTCLTQLSVQKYPAAIFDLDGVITDTARLHAAAWKKMFDKFFKFSNPPITVVPFDIQSDYFQYVDGRSRYDGVAQFLESRHIQLPQGEPSDAPGWGSICALGNMKDQYYLEALKQDTAIAYPSSVELLHTLKKLGVKTAVVSSSKNCTEVLEAAQLSDLFDAQVDGNDIENLNMPGKPAPDTFLYGAHLLNILPENAVMFEDALVGVEAGAKGKFAVVVGVNRHNEADALKAHGATVIIDDLSEICWESP